MLCSIIIPFFNRETLLQETLDSILIQSYPNWECILVDDRSTDMSLEIAKKYSKIDSRIKVYTRPTYYKKGANSCRNYGFKKSKGNYIQWFDSDDLMSSDFIKKKIDALNYTGVDMVVCNASFFSPHINNEKHKTKKSIIPVTDNPAFEFFSGNFWFGTPQAIFKREVIASLPYIFDTNLNRNQETELYVRILLSDLRISYLNESLLYIRVHDDSISGKYIKLSNENKITLDLDAYISIFLAFKKADRLTDDVFNFFSDYFFRCLKKMNCKNINYFYLYFFGNFYSLFPSLIISTRILFYRYRNNV